MEIRKKNGVLEKIEVSEKTFKKTFSKGVAYCNGDRRDELPADLPPHTWLITNH